MVGGVVGGHRLVLAGGIDKSRDEPARLRNPLEPEERARARIAGDIHDDTIQALGAIALNLQNARDAVADPEGRAALELALAQVQDASERLRRLMFELMPPQRTGELRASVQTYCELMLNPSPLTYEVVGDTPPLDSDTNLLAYRLIQEALRNSVRHSNGTRVRIALEYTGGRLQVAVADNGTGMPMEADTAPTHAGLRIAAQRVEAVGGVVVFGPGIGGRGSSVRFVIPVTRAQEL